MRIPMPIFVQPDDGLIFGFGLPADITDKVLIWSVHTIVGEYASLEE